MVPFSYQKHLELPHTSKPSPSPEARLFPHLCNHSQSGFPPSASSGILIAILSNASIINSFTALFLLDPVNLRYSSNVEVRFHPCNLLRQPITVPVRWRPILQLTRMGKLVLLTSCCTASTTQSGELTCTGSAQAGNSGFLDALFTTGTTEEGSSGAPLFQTVGSTRYFVGQLFGGSASCSLRTGSNVYGRFDAAFNAALKQWLAAPVVPTC